MEGIIYNGFGYTAELVGKQAHNGPFLCISKGGKGKYLKGKEAEQWAEHISTAIDSKEALALCRSIFKS